MSAVEVFDGDGVDLLKPRPRRILPDDSTSQPLEVGKTYRTKDGEEVTIVYEDDRNGPYWCVEDSNGHWRYNRPADRGRITGSAHDFSHPKNIVPLPKETAP